MLTPIAFMRAHVERRGSAQQFGTIMNIVSSSVKAPIESLGLRTALALGLVGSSPASRAEQWRQTSPSQQYSARLVRDRSHARKSRIPGQAFGHDGCGRAHPAQRAHSGRARGRPGGIWRLMCLPVQRAGRLYHRAEHLDRRRALSRRALAAEDDIEASAVHWQNREKVADAKKREKRDMRRR